MSRTILSRLGAGLVAAALVAGGSLLVAAPASAAGETITVANTAFQSGAGWGEGLKIEGTSFPALTEVTVNAGVGNGQSGDSWGETTVTTDAEGEFSTTFVPEFGPYDVPEGSTAYVAAGYVDAETEEFVSSNIVELQIAAFVPAAQNVIIDPICLSGDAVRDPGVTVFATGFGQFEEITYDVVDAAGVAVPGDNSTITADETGSVGPAPLSLFSTAGNIPDGVYTITFRGSVTTAGLVTVGNCEVPVAPVEPAAVAAAPQLANTGSSDAGILVGGSALLLLVGAALVVARRRQNADA